MPPPAPATEAYALSLCNVAYAQLLNSEIDASKASLDDCEAVLDKVDNVDPGVLAGFYGVSADYHKVRAGLVRLGHVHVLIRPNDLGQGVIRLILQVITSVPCLHRH